jgi:hypothetical protein
MEDKSKSREGKSKKREGKSKQVLSANRDFSIAYAANPRQCAVSISAREFNMAERLKHIGRPAPRSRRQRPR